MYTVTLFPIAFVYIYYGTMVHRALASVFLLLLLLNGRQAMPMRCVLCVSVCGMHDQPNATGTKNNESRKKTKELNFFFKTNYNVN